MLSPQDNELLTRTSPGTPMGDVLRRYWIPALLSEELPEPDGEPVKVLLLGERLVAFRDTDGRVGILGELCPHRRASLWLGRNEERGLRCIYHGWKFDVDGTCVDQMNEPSETCFASKVRAKAYPNLEMGGIVWTYMGPADKQPPPPLFEWTQVPEARRYVSKVWQECNWLQALEGGLDSSHAPILHRLLTSSDKPGIALSTPFMQAGPPKLELEVTDYGFWYAGVRPLGKDQIYVRTHHYVMPWTQIRPAQIEHGGPFRPLIPGHFWIPIDDENTMVWNWGYHFDEEPLTDSDEILGVDGNGPDMVDAKNEYRSIANRRNNWNIDRREQKYETFTGIRGVNLQDRAAQESMGPIVDRSEEHLGSADRAVIVTRRLLLDAIETVQAGSDPPGAGTSYYPLRAIERILPRGSNWREELNHDMRLDSRVLPPEAQATGDLAVSGS